MNKLLAVTVLVALLALNTECFRVSRQVKEEEGILTTVTNSVKSYYESAIDTITDYGDSIKSLKIEEKAQNFYEELTTVMSTYLGIMQDQIYHSFSSQ
ncbi:apolipoprotein C-II [Brachionichthys hirsutus]|uniref:apolipoprotein C-II n=1 Tax=Brachionichthys hirsutus TaxID=412623 RepID=UPI0036045965